MDKLKVLLLTIMIFFSGISESKVIINGVVTEKVISDIKFELNSGASVYIGKFLWKTLPPDLGAELISITNEHGSYIVTVAIKSKGFDTAYLAKYVCPNFECQLRFFKTEQVQS